MNHSEPSHPIFDIRFYLVQVLLLIVVFELCTPLYAMAQKTEKTTVNIQETIRVLAPKVSSLKINDWQGGYVDKSLMKLHPGSVAHQMLSQPGVYLNGQGGQFQSYSIRGFSRGRIRTEIDGIPILTDRRAGNSASFLASDLISSIKVLKGPSSSLYGSAAMGGVVNLSTESLGWTPSNNQNLIKVSFKPERDGINLTAINQTETSKLGLNIQSEGQSTSSTGDTLNTGFERMSGLYRSSFELDEVTAIFSFIGSIGKNIGKDNIKFPTVEVSQYPEEIHNLEQLHLVSTEGWQAKLFHHYQNWDSLVERTNQYSSLTEYQSHTLGTQFWLPLQSISGITSIDIGFDWLARKGVSISSRTNSLASNNAIEGNSFIAGDQDNVGLFAKGKYQWKWGFFDWGARYDYFKQSPYSSATGPVAGAAQVAESIKPAQTVNSAKSERVLTGSLGLRSEFADMLDININIANGFRFPTLSESFFVGYTPRGYVLGSSNLGPEKSKGVEVGLNWQFSWALTAQINRYHYKVQDYIERYELDDGIVDVVNGLHLSQPVLSYRNTEQATIDGLELTMNWYVNDNVEHRLSYQRQHGKREDGDTIDDIQPKQVIWHSIINTDRVNWANEVRYIAANKEFGPSELARSSRLLVNSSIGYYWTPNILVSLNINNITNQSYFGSLDKNAPQQAGRTIQLAIQWAF